MTNLSNIMIKSGMRMRMRMSLISLTVVSIA
jgi:hypothetical protein